MIGSSDDMYISVTYLLDMQTQDASNAPIVSFSFAAKSSSNTRWIVGVEYDIDRIAPGPTL